jgi:hypothetical protein
MKWLIKKVARQVVSDYALEVEAAVRSELNKKFSDCWGTDVTEKKLREGVTEYLRGVFKYDSFVRDTPEVRAKTEINRAIGEITSKTAVIEAIVEKVRKVQILE